MNDKIFRSSFFTACLVLVLTVAMIMVLLFGAFEERVEDELRSEMVYISHAVEAEGAEYFEDLEIDGKRVTWINADGTVIYDTEADAQTLENHSDREEIKEALEVGTGESSRYSATLSEKTVYYAMLLSDGTVLRLSAEQYTIVSLFTSLLQPILIILVLAVVLCWIISARVSKSIITPINSLDLDHPENNEAYEELAPLLRKIAQQKKTINEQLREAKKLQREFSLITENMSEGFLVIDKDTNLLTYNSAALNLLGIDDTVGQSVLTVCRDKTFREIIEKALCGEKAKQNMAQKDLIYSLIASPVFEKKTVIGAVIIIIDVTESEHRESLRREFTANVSHELKTPLTSISGFAELMKSGGTPEEAVLDFSSSIYDEAQRLITLVNDIIKISELDERSEAFEFDSVDLHALSEDIIRRLRPEAEKKNVTFTLIGDAPSIRGVPRIIDEIIYNLCENAVKYNRDGGSVDIILSAVGEKVNITVKDTGIGIPKQEQSRVFERFYRVDKSHSKKIGGTGLGLAIVKHGAIYHNADVTLKSTEGEGTSVTVSFEKE